MRRVKKMMKAIALALAVCISVPALPAMQAEAAYEAITDVDFLKANGKNLENRNGEVVNLRGTNAGGYLLQEMWMTPTESTTNVSDETEIFAKLEERFGEAAMYEVIDIYQDAYWTEADFDNCAALGMNVIRLPFWWRNLVDENGVFYGYNEASTSSVSGNVSGNETGTNDPYATAFARMDWFVAEAAERGMYVIIDFHGAPGSQNGSDHSGVDGGNAKEAASRFFFGDGAQANQELYYDMWEVIAERYAGNPAVAGYDLLNEPFCTWRYNSALTSGEGELLTMLWDVYDKAYDRIRAVDADHVIIMEATWNPSDLPNPAVYGWENVMYEYHNYLYDSYTDVDAQVASMQSKLSAIANTDYNVPSYIGEFSYFDLPESWDAGLELLNESGINWTTWTYKTVSTYGMWGLYHHTVNNKINLETATLDEIKAHYAKMGEATVNSALADVAVKYFGAAMVENQLGPKYVELEDGTYYLVGNSCQKVLANETEAGNAVGAGGVSISLDDATQQFELVNNGDDTVSLKSVTNGKYVTVANDKLLYATSESITDAEKFWMVECSKTQVGLKSVKTSLFVCADEDLKTEMNVDYIPLIADRSSTTGWEMFQIYDAEGNMIGGEPLALHSGWTRYEAENATIVGDAKVEEQSFYSEGKGVGSFTSTTATDAVAADMSNVKHVAFQVTAPEAGEYKMVIGYNGDDDKTIAVQANDSEVQLVDVPRLNGGKWDDRHEVVTYVTLAEGENTVRVSGALADTGWMNLDCVDIVDYPIVNNQGTERLEGEEYYFTANLDKQSHYSGGAGVGGLNSDTAVDSVAANWSNIKYVNFSIYAEEAGEYKITWGYTGANATDMVALYKLNDGTSQQIKINNDGGDWNIPATLDFNVNLNQGFNTLMLSGTLVDSGHYMNIDYIDVRNTALGELVEAPTAESGWTRYEAETLERQGGNVELQDFYSCGKGAGGMNMPDVTSIEDVADDMSNVNYVKLEVTAPAAGDYRLVFGYNGDDDKIGAIKVNDGAIEGIDLPRLAGGQWDAMLEKYLEVTLKEGANTILISGAVGSGWYNIDYIDVCNAAISVIDETTGTERYEAENFEVKSANNPAVESQSFYSGVGALGVGGMGTTLNSFVEGSNILDSRLNNTNFTVWAETAGTYSITLAANGAGNVIPAVYQVNDNASVFFSIDNSGFGWDHMVLTTFEAELEAGYNTVVIAGSTDGSWINFDYIDVTPAVDDGSDDDGEGGDAGDDGEGDVVELPAAESGWTRYEAETLERKGGKVEAQSFYSCGNGAGGLNMPDVTSIEDVAEDMSNVNYVKLEVTAPAAGDYRLVFGYNGDDDKIGAIKVNDGAIEGIDLPRLAGGQWDAMLEKYLEVTLKEGANTILISGAVGSGWYNIDYIDVCNAAISVIDETTGTERYEAENFETKSSNATAVESQSFYSGALGVGGMGTTMDAFVEGTDILDSGLNNTNFTVWAEVAGTYSITLAANGAGNVIPAVYQVNDNASVFFSIDNSGFGWDHMVLTTFEVELEAGYNTVVIAGSTDGSWINFDYIDVTPVVDAGDDGDTDDNTGDAGDDGDTDDNTGDDGDDGDTDDNAGDAENSGNTDDNTNDGGSQDNTQSNTGNADNGGNTSSNGNDSTSSNGGNTVNNNSTGVANSEAETDASEAEDTVENVEDNSDVTEDVDADTADTEAENAESADVVEETGESDSESDVTVEETVEIEDESVPITGPATEKNSSVFVWIVLAVLIGAAVLVGTKIYFTKKENEDII